jgi:hypothetical protein
VEKPAEVLACSLATIPYLVTCVSTYCNLISKLRFMVSASSDASAA